MLNKILLPFSLVSNLATLLGLWIAFASASASIQEKVGHLLILCGAVASIIAYALFAVFLMRPRSEIQSEPKPEAAKDEPSATPPWCAKMAADDAQHIRVLSYPKQNVSVSFLANPKNSYDYTRVDYWSMQPLVPITLAEVVQRLDCTPHAD